MNEMDRKEATEPGLQLTIPKQAKPNSNAKKDKLNVGVAPAVIIGAAFGAAAGPVGLILGSMTGLIAHGIINGQIKLPLKEQHNKRPIHNKQNLSQKEALQFFFNDVNYDIYDVKKFNAAEIQTAYRKLVKMYHPDRKNGDTAGWQKVAEYHEVLISMLERINWYKHDQLVNNINEAIHGVRNKHKGKLISYKQNESDYVRTTSLWLSDYKNESEHIFFEKPSYGHFTNYYHLSRPQFDIVQQSSINHKFLYELISFIRNQDILNIVHASIKSMILNRRVIYVMLSHYEKTKAVLGFNNQEHKKEDGCIDEIEMIINDELADYIMTDEEYMHFKQQFLTDYKGIIECPNYTDKNDSGGGTNLSIAATTNIHVPSGKNDGNGGDEENNHERKNNDGNDSNKPNHNRHHHERCNHLYECAQCNQVLIQKDYEIMLLQERIKGLQREITTFKNVMNDINDTINQAADGNLLNAKSNKSKSAQKSLNSASYEPIKPSGAKGYVQIPHNLTDSTLPDTADESVFNWFDYMKKTIAIQLHDQQIGNVNDDDQKQGDKIIIKVDLHELVNREQIPLFVVLQRNDMDKNYQFTAIDKLFKASDLPRHSVPKSSRDTFEIKKEMKEIALYLKQDGNIDKLLKSCKWSKIPSYKAKKKKNKQRMVFSITEQELKETIKLHLSYYETRLIPILMFTNHGHHVEYILVIDSYSFGAIGISMKHNINNNNHDMKYLISGLHIDWDRIRLAHHAVDPQHVNKCQCMAGFQAMHIVDEFYVRNPDHWDNLVKDKQNKNEKARDTLYKIREQAQRFMDDEESKESIQYDSSSISSMNRQINEHLPSSQSSLTSSTNNYNSATFSSSLSLSPSLSALPVNGSHSQNESAENATQKCLRNEICNDIFYERDDGKKRR